jgi:myo-inositol-1(or 4)-monophosphatase
MNDIEVAIAVAERGAGIIRQQIGTTLRRIDKGNGDFATNADIEAERAMRAVLYRERPEDAVLGEESGQGGSASSQRMWLIDPLCGTLNYTVKMRLVAVNVALRNGEGFVAAAVADPFNDEIFWSEGASAYSRTGGRDVPLTPNGSSRLVDLNFDPPFPNGATFKTTTLAADPEFVVNFRPRVISSTIALAWVASGQRAAYVTDGDVRDSVHFAAGLAICEAAGCKVTDLRGQPWRRSGFGLVAAADGLTHATLIRLIGKYLS